MALTPEQARNKGMTIQRQRDYEQDLKTKKSVSNDLFDRSKGASGTSKDSVFTTSDKYGNTVVLDSSGGVVSAEGAKSTAADVQAALKAAEKSRSGKTTMETAGGASLTITPEQAAGDVGRTFEEIDGVLTPTSDQIVVPEATTTTTETPTETTSSSLTAIPEPTEPINQDFLNERTAFLSSLGDSQQTVSDAIASFESNSGVLVDTTNAQLREEIKAALLAGTADLSSIFQKYTTPAGVTTSEVPGKEVSAETQKLEETLVNTEVSSKATDAKRAYDSGYMTEDEYSAFLKKIQPTAADAVIGSTIESTYTAPTEISIANALSSFDGESASSALNTLSSLTGKDPSELTSAEANLIWLANMQLEMGETMAGKLSELFTSMKDRAADAYASAISSGSVATDEIQDVMDNASAAVTTIEALMVKAQKQQTDLGIESISAQEDALNAEYEYTFTLAAEQNARLEGYMKAKLNFMGASTSSSGLTLMGLVIGNAQARLLMYQNKHTAELVQLELAKTGLMNDYYNKVQEQLISIKDSQSTALTTYNDKLDEIELQEIQSEEERQTQTLTTLSGLIQNLYTVQTDQKEWEYKLMTDQWQMAMDEAKFAQDVESEQRSQIGDNMSAVLNASIGKSFDQLDEETQKALLDWSAFLGLPASYARQTLDSQLAALRSSSSGGSGSSSEGGLEMDVLLTLADQASYGELSDGEALDRIKSIYGSSSTAKEMAAMYLNLRQATVAQNNSVPLVYSSYTQEELDAINNSANELDLTKAL